MYVEDFFSLISLLLFFSFLCLGSISPGPVFDLADIPLEGIDVLGNPDDIQDVAKKFVLAELEQGQGAEEQRDDASMWAALSANSLNNNELGAKVYGTELQNHEN